jgi:signal transduction histidine kinase
MTALQRPHDDAITGEQAALRRVATLVARAAPPEKVFAAVTEEAGRLLDAHQATMSRYVPDGTIVVAAWGKAGAAFPVGSRWSLGGRNPPTLVFQTCQPARTDDYADVSDLITQAARQHGLISLVGVPVSVEGRLWGVMLVGSTREDPLPSGTEARLAGFTELAATAIANAQARVELRGFADEQAALRRVATLVARASLPEEVFAAVTEEAGRVLDADHATMNRYDPGGARTVVAAWSSTGPTFPVGNRIGLGGGNVPTMVSQTGRAARINDYAGDDASGPIAEAVSAFGLRAAVGVPVSVEGRLWGVMIVGSWAEPLAADTEARLAGFTELAATAIASAQARMELRGFADEQAALRRVATLVARAAAPAEVFASVTEEAGRLLHADYATMNTYGPDGTSRVVAGWDSTGAVFPVGTQAMLGGQNVSTLVFQTGRAARIDDYAGASGPVADTAREFGFGAAVGVPVGVEGRMWGVMVVASREEPLPAGTEARLAGFTELAATAIANAEAQAALTASRARIVTTADQTRRRIERDLHDGAQQRLVSLVLQLREARTTVPSGAGELAQQLEHAVADVTGVLEELRETARGLHPAILAEGGLRPALAALARRSAVPVRLDVQVAGRLPEQAEIAGYYVAAEALTNTAKHAHATTVDVQVTASEDLLRVRVSDDGLGGADFARGSGLIGLRDRTEALGGEICLHSPPGAGTVLEIALPLGPGGPGLPPDADGPAENATRGLAADPGTRIDHPGAARPAERDPSAPDRDGRPPG